MDRVRQSDKGSGYDAGLVCNMSTMMMWCMLLQVQNMLLVGKSSWCLGACCFKCKTCYWQGNVHDSTVLHVASSAKPLTGSEISCCFKCKTC